MYESNVMNKLLLEVIISTKELLSLLNANDVQKGHHGMGLHKRPTVGSGAVSPGTYAGGNSWPSFAAASNNLKPFSQIADYTEITGKGEIVRKVQDGKFIYKTEKGEFLISYAGDHPNPDQMTKQIESEILSDQMYQSFLKNNPQINAELNETSSHILNGHLCKITKLNELDNANPSQGINDIQAQLIGINGLMGRVVSDENPDVVRLANGKFIIQSDSFSKWSNDQVLSEFQSRQTFNALNKKIQTMSQENYSARMQLASLAQDLKGTSIQLDVFETLKKDLSQYNKEHKGEFNDVSNTIDLKDRRDYEIWLAHVIFSGDAESIKSKTQRLDEYIQKQTKSWQEQITYTKPLVEELNKIKTSGVYKLDAKFVKDQTDLAKTLGGAAETQITQRLNLIDAFLHGDDKGKSDFINHLTKLMQTELDEKTSKTEKFTSSQFKLEYDQWKKNVVDHTANAKMLREKITSTSGIRELIAERDSFEENSLKSLSSIRSSEVQSPNNGQWKKMYGLGDGVDELFRSNDFHVKANPEDVFASIKMAKTSAIAAKKDLLKNIDETISDPLMKKAIIAKFDKRLESLDALDTLVTHMQNDSGVNYDKKYIMEFGKHQQGLLSDLVVEKNLGEYKQYYSGTANDLRTNNTGKYDYFWDMTSEKPPRLIPGDPIGEYNVFLGAIQCSNARVAIPPKYSIDVGKYMKNVGGDYSQVAKWAQSQANNSNMGMSGALRIGFVDKILQPKSEDDVRWPNRNGVRSRGAELEYMYKQALLGDDSTLFDKTKVNVDIKQLRKINESLDDAVNTLEQAKAQKIETIKTQKILESLQANKGTSLSDTSRKSLEQDLAATIGQNKSSGNYVYEKEYMKKSNDSYVKSLDASNGLEDVLGVRTNSSSSSDREFQDLNFYCKKLTRSVETFAIVTNRVKNQSENNSRYYESMQKILKTSTNPNENIDSKIFSINMTSNSAADYKKTSDAYFDNSETLKNWDGSQTAFGHRFGDNLGQDYNALLAQVKEIHNGFQATIDTMRKNGNPDAEKFDSAIKKTISTITLEIEKNRTDAQSVSKTVKDVSNIRSKLLEDDFAKLAQNNEGIPQTLKQLRDKTLSSDQTIDSSQKHVDNLSDQMKTFEKEMEKGLVVTTNDVIGKSMTIQNAATYLMLDNIKLPFHDQSSKTVTVFRTESDSRVYEALEKQLKANGVLSSSKDYDYSELQQYLLKMQGMEKTQDRFLPIPRAYTDSFSAFTPVSIENPYTCITEMPFHRVLGTFFQTRPASSVTAGETHNTSLFCGTGELEYLCMPTGVPSFIMTDQSPITRTLESLQLTDFMNNRPSPYSNTKLGVSKAPTFTDLTEFVG